MGIGRDAFVRRYRDQLGILAVSGLVEGCIGNTYINRAHGVAFEKPFGWEFQGLEETVRSQAGNVLNFEGLVHEAFAEYTKSMTLHAPYVTVADIQGARFIPEATSPDVDKMALLALIAFEGTWEDDWEGPSEAYSLESWVDRDLHFFEKGYENFRVVGGPTPITISNCEAMQYVAEYDFGHVHLPFTLPMRETAIYVSQRPAIHGVRMVDFPKADPPITFDYKDFIASLCFV